MRNDSPSVLLGPALYEDPHGYSEIRIRNVITRRLPYLDASAKQDDETDATR